MILGEFAVNHEAIIERELRDLSAITMLFGFHNGAIISSFPSNWLAKIKDKARSELDGTTEYLRVIEQLDFIKKNILIKSGRGYDGNNSWLENALTQQEEKPFFRIIHSDSSPSHAEVLSFDKLDQRVIENLREGKVKRDATSLAEVSRLLLANSNNIQFIDPYFSAQANNGKLNQGFFKSFEQMFNFARVFERNNIASIHIHTSYKHGQTEVDIEGEKEILNKHYKKLVPSSQSIKFFWWDDEDTGEVHPRYLVTEKGGIRFDRGFIEPASHEQREAETDVSMMTTKMIALISQQYRKESSSYTVVDTHIVQGEG